jgi:hypothetical protein
MFLIWRFHCSRPEFLAVYASQRAARAAITKAGAGWTITAVERAR